MTENFYEIYHLLIRDKNYPDFLICEKIQFETQDNSNIVEFNYKAVMECEDDKNTEVIGFFHTHPDNHCSMSNIDIKTMKAWVACFGRSLLCVIGCENKYSNFSSYDLGPIEYLSPRIITNGWWCCKNISLPIKVSEFDPNKYLLLKQ